MTTMTRTTRTTTVRILTMTRWWMTRRARHRQRGALLEALLPRTLVLLLAMRRLAALYGR